MSTLSVFSALASTFFSAGFFSVAFLSAGFLSADFFSAVFSTFSTFSEAAGLLALFGASAFFLASAFTGVFSSIMLWRMACFSALISAAVTLSAFLISSGILPGFFRSAALSGEFLGTSIIGPRGLGGVIGASEGLTKRLTRIPVMVSISSGRK